MNLFPTANVFSWDNRFKGLCLSVSEKSGMNRPLNQQSTFKFQQINSKNLAFVLLLFKPQSLEVQLCIQLKFHSTAWPTTFVFPCMIFMLIWMYLSNNMTSWIIITCVGALNNESIRESIKAKNRVREWACERTTDAGIECWKYFRILHCRVI